MQKRYRCAPLSHPPTLGLLTTAAAAVRRRELLQVWWSGRENRGSRIGLQQIQHHGTAQYDQVDGYLQLYRQYVGSDLRVQIELRVDGEVYSGSSGLVGPYHSSSSLRPCRGLLELIALLVESLLEVHQLLVHVLQPVLVVDRLHGPTCRRACMHGVEQSISWLKLPHHSNYCTRTNRSCRQLLWRVWAQW